MVKVLIDRTENHPGYAICIFPGTYTGKNECEVSEETVDRWQKTFSEFKRVQEEIEQLLRNKARL